MHRVLVVGAGATGSAAAWRLRQLGQVKLEVWEKARGPGGRMSTNRQEVSGATVRADMGAQYVSVEESDSATMQVAERLLSSGVCAEVSPELLTATPERPVRAKHLAGTAGGVNDALKTLLEEADATVHYEKRVASLDLQSGSWRARPFEGAPGMFDAVLIAVPGCGVGGDNLLKIHGSWEGMLKQDQNKQLMAAQHDQRWSFAFFLPSDCQAVCERYFGPKVVEKLVDDEVVHLLCYQSRKTEIVSLDMRSSPVVVAHSTTEWAKRHAQRGGKDERLLREMAAHVQKLIGLEGPLSQLTSTSKVITWKQCQVQRPVTSEAVPFMAVTSAPPLLLAGDYFTSSSFSGCVRSGFAAAEALSALLKDVTPKAGGGRERERNHSHHVGTQARYVF
ncbi:unnamed protein product [Durusdinium trenchii]|uniref:Amine oxidase domain-containing protein n=2 Tax=Durusdinium trenchii TaxID=1381693 RepID=A0ABP0Q6S0_9DINO